MHGKNCFAVGVSLAIWFLFVVLFTNDGQAAEPSQDDPVLGPGSSRIQVAQTAAPTMEPTLPSPPSPKKPHPTTGVPGRSMTRSLEPFAQGDPKAGAKIFNSLRCASCHGESGMGQGPAAKAMKIKASDWTDKTAMSKLPDKFLKAIIMKGGTAVAKSKRMPAYSKKLKPAELEDLVANIRSFAK